jgi:hypothetical protein
MQTMNIAVFQSDLAGAHCTEPSTALASVPSIRQTGFLIVHLLGVLIAKAYAKLSGIGTQFETFRVAVDDANKRV